MRSLVVVVAVVLLAAAAVAAARKVYTQRDPAVAAPSTPYNARWMERIFPVLENRTLYDVTLPGTHDSAAYLLYDQLDPDIDSELLQRLIERAIELGIPVWDLMEGWALCQTRTLAEQLAGGIRSLDLRAAWDGEQWVAIHFLLGEPYTILLREIVDFLEAHPYEVLHLLIGNLGGSAPASPERQLLLNQFTAALGPYMYPPTADLVIRDTIGEMVAKGQRVIVFYPDPRDLVDQPLFWPEDETNEGRYAASSDLETMEAHNVNLIETLNGNNLVFTVSWTLTAQVDDIIRGLPPNATTRTLYELIRPASDRLDGFFRERATSRLGNILINDYFEETNLVEIAKAWNRRDCNDVAAYRARDPVLGEDCRSWAEAGRCESDPVFMRPNCPLSCGICTRLAGEPGDACSTPTECISAVCGPTGICLTDDPLPVGAACGVDNQCANGLCDQPSKRCV